MPRKKWFSLALASFLAMTARHAAAQDSFYEVTEPAAVFSGGAEYLLMTRDHNFNGPSNFISGPDAGRINFNNTDFDFESGYRGFLALSNQGIRVEGVYTNFGRWQYGNAGSLTNGLAFDEGAVNDWTGDNFINLTTGFSSLHAAAAGGMGGDADEFEGLGPVGAFADTLPTFETYYHSRMQSWEVNFVTEDPEAHFQFGAGYSHFDLSETTGVSIVGTLRAIDVAAPNGGISHTGLTTFGGLTHLGGVANGFEDEVGNASGFADVLQMQHNAGTRNNLNGVQLLFQEEIMYWRGWTIDGTLKTGLYNNSMTGTVSERYIGTDPITGESSTYGRTFFDKKTDLAFGVAVGLKSNFPLSDHWSLLTGYEMTFLDGVALAPEQYGAISGTTFVNRRYDINDNGQIIAHGANVGLQFAY